MLRVFSTLLSAGLLTGCISTQDRPMNAREQTLLSPEVAKLVAADEDGILDTRQVPEIRCERFKRTGSHMVLRHCYTVGEEDEMVADAQGKMQDRFGKIQCLEGSTNDLDTIFIKFFSQLQCCLTAQLNDHAFGLLKLDDVINVFPEYRLKI